MGETGRGWVLTSPTAGRLSVLVTVASGAGVVVFAALDAGLLLMGAAPSWVPAVFFVGFPLTWLSLLWGILILRSRALGRRRSLDLRKVWKLLRALPNAVLLGALSLGVLCWLLGAVSLLCIGEGRRVALAQSLLPPSIFAFLLSFSFVFACADLLTRRGGRLHPPAGPD